MVEIREEYATISNCNKSVHLFKSKLKWIYSSGKVNPEQKIELNLSGGNSIFNILKCQAFLEYICPVFHKVINQEHYTLS